MKITYDPKKNERNVELRGPSFDRAVDFDFETALMVSDDRKDYGELRVRALGLLDGPRASPDLRRDRQGNPRHQFPSC